jgi:glutamine amidotransferase
MIAIIDYGAGASPRLTSDKDELAAANGLVLPGVGAFAPALRRLEQGNLGRWIVELARKGRPLLGVCLGYQLLFEESEEHGRHEGLGLLEGRVVEVTESPRLPVIGWCRLRQTEWSPLWTGIADASYFYFVHSFTPDGSRDALGATEHSPVAAAGRLNVMGTQFHPEKSGADGLRVYANFLSVCGGG